MSAPVPPPIPWRKIGVKLIRWVGLSLIVGASPVIFTWISAVTHGRVFILDEVLAKGDLILLAAATSAAGLGEMIGIGIQRWLALKVLTGVTSALLFGIASFWYGDISASVAAQQSVDAGAIATGSIWMFIGSIVVGIPCVALSEVD